MKRAFPASLRLPAMFLLAVTALFIWTAPIFAATEDGLFQNAETARRNLERDAKAKSLRHNWLEVVKRFERVAREFPQGRLADKALAKAADLYLALFRLSRVNEDLDNALETNRRLIKNHPQSPLAAQAQLNLGEALWRHKKDAERAYVELLKVELNHPHNKAEVAEARQLMAEISRATGQSPPLDRSETAPPDQTKADAARTAPGQKALVTGLRHWQNPNYSRVAVDLDREVGFKDHILRPDPEHNQPLRLYLDLKDARIAPSLKDELIIADGLVKRARLAQYDPETVRVVLDIQHIKNYRIFSIANPFRILIDVTGQDEEPASPGQPAPPDPKAEPRPGPEKPAEAKSDPAPEPKTDPKSKPRVEVKSEAKSEKKDAKDPKHEVKPEPKEVKPETKIKPGGPTRPEPTPPLEDLRSAALKRKQIPRGPAQTDPTTQTSLARQLGLGVRKIVLDAGHGGKDHGATGVTGLREKDLTLALAQLLAAKLREQLGLTVVLTRDKDVFLPLEERTALANTHGADLFISLHANAHPSAKVNGIETYFLNITTDKEAMRVAERENASTSKNMSDLQKILRDLMLNSKIAESANLGAKVHRALIVRLGRKYKIHDLGVKQAPFYVLIGANMPSLLVEVGFISNQAEESRLRNKQYLDLFADGLLDGIKAYLASIKKAG
ncbi:MAG: N-acetylmuramoyl-L-alanine amidase [Thermodesulfobacteriota bacterium]